MTSRVICLKRASCGPGTFRTAISVNLSDTNLTFINHTLLWVAGRSEWCTAQLCIIDPLLFFPNPLIMLWIYLQYEKSCDQHFQGGWTNTGMGTKDGEGCFGQASRQALWVPLVCLSKMKLSAAAILGISTQLQNAKLMISCSWMAGKKTVLELDGRNGDDPGLKAKEIVDFKSWLLDQSNYCIILNLDFPSQGFLS